VRQLNRGRKGPQGRGEGRKKKNIGKEEMGEKVLA
jgi:hypothetical protein